MALRTFHPDQFHFDDQDIRREGLTTSGGPSLSGIEEPISTDGGGKWVADFANGEPLDRAGTLAWRAITEGMDGGATAVIVYFCDRLHQPVGDAVTVPHSDDTPFDDDSEYSSGGATATAAAAALRATTLTISIASEKPLIGGEMFSIEHATWGWRVYRIISIDGATIQFRPPLREAIAADTPLEFDSPRCQMLLAGATSNPLNMGRFTSCSIRFVEDMRKPT